MMSTCMKGIGAVIMKDPIDEYTDKTVSRSKSRGWSLTRSWSRSETISASASETKAYAEFLSRYWAERTSERK